MEVEILQIVASSGGGVVVCVALVILFLRHVQEMNSTHETVIKDLGEKFTEEHRGTREAFQSQITMLTGQVFAVADRTTAAVSELKNAVVELQSRIK